MGEKIINGDFENGISGWNTWSGYGTLSSVSSPVRNGNKSMQIVGGTSGAQAYQYLTLTPGTEYALTGWVYMPSFTSGSYVFLSIYDSTKGYLFGREYLYGGPTPGWVRLGPYKFTVPAGISAWPYVQLGGAGNEAVIYWDDLTLSSAGAVTTDWYSKFVIYADYMAPYTYTKVDGGELAWGESYMQRVYINLYEAYKNTMWLDFMVRGTDTMISNMSDVPRFSPYWSNYVDGYAGWGQNRYTQYTPNYTEWFGDDGLIISNILRFVEIVWNDPNLHFTYKAKADNYISTIEQYVIAKWYANWAATRPGGQNNGFALYDWSGWINQPLNMYLSFTDGMITLRRLSTSPYYTPYNSAFPAWYISTTDSMLNDFRSWMVVDAPGQCYYWKYGPRTYWPNLWEDVGHGFIDVQAAIQGYQLGVAFNSSDLQKMANVFCHHVWYNGSFSDPAFRYYLNGAANNTYDSPNGTYPQGHWGWGFLYLSGYDYRIWELMSSYFDKRIVLKDNSPYVSVTAAMLAYAAKLYDIYPPGQVQNFTVDQGDINDVHISWNPPSQDADGTNLTEIAGYKIYRSDDGQNGVYNAIMVHPITALYYNDKNSFGHGYRYKAAAVDYAGNEGPSSQPLLGGTLKEDFDNNGLIDANDLNFISSQWLSDNPTLHPETGKSPDLVLDGIINYNDFALFAIYWLY